MRFLNWSQAKEKRILQLHKKKYRKEHNLFLLEGYRAVEQAVSNGFLQFDSILITDVFKETVPYWTFLNQSEPPMYLLSAKEMKAITTTEQAPGCIAICVLPESLEVESIAKSAKRLLALDRIQDPGNLGTIIRTALWFGWDGLLVGEGTVDLFNPKVVRSTVGATACLPFSNVNLETALVSLEEQEWNISLLDLDDDSIDLRKAELPKGSNVVVLGNEANGIQAALKTKGRRKYHISTSSQNLIESLNVAVALGIGLYHFGQNE